MVEHDAASKRILQGRLAWEIARFGAPLAFGMGLQTTFNLVDAYVIARLDPDIAGSSLGAIGICDQIAALGTIVSYGVSIATAAMVGQRQGRGDYDGVRTVAWQSLLIVAALAAVYGVVGLLFSAPLMHDIVGAKGSVATFGERYLKVIVGGSFSIFFLLQITAIQRALGSSKTPAVLLVAANVLNLLLAVLLVYGPGQAPPVFAWGPPIARVLGIPRMELVGAAWATVLARTIALVPLAIVFERRFCLVRKLRSFLPNPAQIRDLVSMAWPASAQLVVRIFAMLVTQSLVARAFTTSTDQRASTALGLVFRLETLALFIGMGWGSAAQTFLAQNLGAHQPRRAVRSGYFAAGYNSLAMVLLAAAFITWARPVVGFFDDDPAVVATALGYLQIIAPSYLALGIGIVLGSAIQGAGATKLTLAIDAAVVAVFQLPLSIIVVSRDSAVPPHLWWVVAGASVLSAIAYIVVYRRQDFVRRAS